MWCLFKLNRSRRFRSQIVKYSVNSLNLINNSAHHLIQYIIRNFSSLSCHEIYSCYCSQSNSIIVCSLIPHNSDTSHVCQCCEILVNILVKSCVCNLFSVDGICILNDLNFFFCYFTDDTDSKSRSGMADGIPVSPEFQAPILPYVLRL